MSINWSKYGVTEKNKTGIDWAKYTTPEPVQPVQQESKSNWFADSQKAIYNKTLKPVQDFTNRAATSFLNSTGLGQPTKILQNNQPDNVPSFVTDMYRPAETTSEKVADVTGVLGGTVVPYSLAYKTAGKGLQLGYNALTKGIVPVSKLGKASLNAGRLSAGGLGAGLGYGVASQGADELLNPNDATFGERAKIVAIEGALGAVGDPALRALGVGLKKAYQSYSPSIKNKVDGLIGRFKKGEINEEQLKDEILMLPEGKTYMKASETPQPIQERFIGGKKNTARDVSREYNKALEEQFQLLKNQSKMSGHQKGGTMISLDDKANPIYQRYGTVSNRPQWYQEFKKAHGREPTQKDLRKLAEEQLKNGYMEGGSKIPAWQPKSLSEIDEGITEVQQMMLKSNDPSLQNTLTALAQGREKVSSSILKNNRARTPTDGRTLKKPSELNLNVSSRLKDNPVNFTMLDKKPLEYVGRLAPMNKVKVQKGTSELTPKLAQSEETPLKAFNLTSKDTNIEYPFETGGLKPSLQASKEAAAGSLRSLEPKLKPLNAQSFTPAEKAFIDAQKKYEPLAKKDFKEWTKEDFALNEQIRKPMQAAELNLQKQGYSPNDIDSFMKRHESGASLSSKLPELKPTKLESLSKSSRVEKSLNHYSAKQKELEKLIKDGADDKQINAARNQAKEIARSMDADQLAKDLYIKPPSMKVVNGKQTINADDFTPQRVQQAMNIALDNSNVNWAGATDQNIFFGNFKTLHRLVNSMFKENTLKAEPKNLVKRIGIDSFNDSKREMHKHLEAIASDLKTNLQQFGITKNSKKSAIAMAHGEGKISLEEVQRQFPNDWQQIVAAKDYARKFYDDMIDMQNEVLRKIHANLKGDALNEKLIPKRKDYFRHMQEDIAKYRDVLDLIDSAAGIRNVDDVVKPLAKKGKDLGTRLKEKALGRPIKIDPELVGTSEYTNPRSKFNTTKLKRTTDETDFDLMGGMLDYSNQATYQMYVSPYIQVIDALEKGLVARTPNGNMNKYIELFQGIKQVLQGKTLPFDRAIQKKLGREVMRAIDAVNTRVRKNSVLASASSMAAQYTHLPNAIAIGGVKNFTDGAKEYFKHVFKKGGLDDPLKSSTFMKERYATNDLLRQFETGFINKATDKAGKISLEVMDKIAGEITWRTMYSKALKEGSKNAIRRADDLTRDILGARGRGEKSLIMSERMTNMYLPFQLEVANNAMIMGELIKNRQGKEFLRLMTANYLFNGLVGYTVGRKFMFDPIKGMYDAYQLAQEEAETSQKIYKAAGRIAGEIASPLPGAGVWGSAILTPQFRKSFFGDVDPTRYGSEPLITGAINDPLFKFATPFGGAQLKRTLQGASSLAQGGNYGSDLSNLQRGAKTLLGGESADDGKKLRFPVERTPANTVRALVGGPWNTKEGKEYLEKNRRPLSANQTQDLLKKADRGRDSASLYQSLMLDRELASIEKKIKEERKEGKTIDQIQKLLDRRLEIMSEKRKLNSIK